MDVPPVIVEHKFEKLIEALGEAQILFKRAELIAAEAEKLLRVRLEEDWTIKEPHGIK